MTDRPPVHIVKVDPSEADWVADPNAPVDEAERREMMRQSAKLIDLARAKCFRRSGRMLPASDWLMICILVDSGDWVARDILQAQLPLAPRTVNKTIERLEREGMVETGRLMDQYCKPHAVRVLEFGIEALAYVRWQRDTPPQGPTQNGGQDNG